MKAINLTFILMAFITIVVGMVLINQIADDTTQITTPFTHTNESLNIASLRYGADEINETLNVTLPFKDWVPASVTIKRTNGTAFILNTDYWVDYTNERISFANTTAVAEEYASNITRAYYQYYGASYVDDSGTRVVIPLIVILFAIGILLAVVAYLRKDSEGIF